MIKVIACINRKPGWSVEDFQKYWLEEHPKPVLKLDGVRRYVQSHVRPSGYRNGRQPIHDGIAELWFDDMDALRAVNASAAYKAVQEDEARFIDSERLFFLLTEEHVIVDGAVPEPAVKNVEFVHRKPGMPVEDFQRYWREVHGPIAAHIPSIRRYVQSHVRLGAYRDGRQPPCDGLAITWFDSTDAMRAGARTEAYETTRRDEPNFIAPGELPIIICDEHVIVAG